MAKQSLLHSFSNFIFCANTIFFLLLISHVSQTELLNSETALISRHLVLNENYTISWTVSGDSAKEIIFKGEVRTTQGYVGLGISLNGAMKGADIAILRYSADGKMFLEDRHGVGNVEPVLDDSQDWTLISGSRNDTHTKFEISRLLNTGDKIGDLEITVDTLRLIWAYGMDEFQQISYHGSMTRGLISVNFLDPDVETLSPEELSEKYAVFKTQRHVLVSPNDTVYMCSFFKGPNVSKKHHMVGFGMYIDRPEVKRHLHHADLYRCAAPPGVNPDEFFGPFLTNDYDCNYSPIPFPNEYCGLFEFQWTIGGGVTMFPDNLGMPIGSSNGATEYYMTEVHFDNPDRLQNLEITAGFNIYYTPDLRETEVGHLQLGVMTNKTYSLTVPPNSTDFIVSSHCPMDCTSNIPEEGITVFTYLLHSHLSGRKLKLRHYRNEVELPPIARDDNFDFKYQNNRRLLDPVKILPGDHLTIECTYDTNWKRGKVTIGGRAARDEMCQAFLLYYPRMETINSCGSYIPHQRILDYMNLTSVSQYQGEIDATVVSPGPLAGLKYSHVVENMISWTRESREEYQRIVRYGDQQAYCIPIHYHNESFVMTNYVLTEVHSNDASIWSSKSTIVSATIILSVLVLAGIISIVVARRKRLSNEKEIEK